MTTCLPPFGKKFRPVPDSGVRVAVGPGAWDFRKTHHCPIMVLPNNANPCDFNWPSDGKPALIYECGSVGDEGLYAIAKALLVAGAPTVVAVCESTAIDDDPRIFFDPDVQYVSG